MDRARPLFLLWLWLLPTVGCGRSERAPQPEPAEDPAEAAASLPSSTPEEPLQEEIHVELPPKALSPLPTSPADGQVPVVHHAMPASLSPISGEEIRRRVASSSAKATLVNAWASWCGPCRREFPMFIALREALAGKGVEVHFVSVDDDTTYPEAVAFAERHGETPPFWVSKPPLGEFKRELHPGWPGMLPATFLFDSRGDLRYFWGGPVFDHEVLPVVEGLLRGEKIDGETRQGLKKGVDY